MTYSIKQRVTFDPANTSAFGTLESSEMTPVVQMDFVYGLNTQTGVSTVANSATVNTNASRLLLQSGTNSAGSAIFQSRKIAKYRAGQGMTARFTCAFATGTASNTQICWVGNATDWVFFGYNGTSFGILHRNGGSDTWTAQSSWNWDKADGTGASAFNWNKQVGNVMMIKYPYLGYGDINFFVQDSVTGVFILVHTVRYANTSTATEFSNPSMFFYVQNLNSGNTTNLTMYCGSAAIFISGKRDYTSSPRWGAESTKTGITTETNIITLKNATTYNGVTNRWVMRLSTVSVANGATGTNGTCTIRLKINATLGGSPSYTTISGSTADNGTTITSGNSPASYDVAGTTVTGGTTIFNNCVTLSNNNVVDLTDHDIFVAPGETLTISATNTSSSSVAVAVNWFCDI